MATSLYKRKRLEFITIIYWFLLLYILAALIWWFIALLQQNEQMVNFKKLQLNRGDADYQISLDLIEKERKRKITQYGGEGITFMLLILVGAVFVYRAVRRQIKLSAQQQDFMIAITHELKTPIAVTKLNLETLRKRRLDEFQQERLIQNTLQEANRLNDLCNNMLLASQMDTGGYRLTKEDVNLSELVNNAVQDFRYRFPRRSIESLVGDNIFFFGDALLLQLAINNLIENALKYSPKEKPVLVTLQKVEGGSRFEVIDAGTGISNTEKKKVFDKFYRIGTEIARQTKGTGLGLYLTKKIAEDHAAEITVTDNSPTGSIFVIRFTNEPE